MTASTDDSGIIDKPSHHSVDETVKRLQDILRTKGVTVFALIDHSGEAAKAGMKMPPTRLVIFGNPKAGTSLMLAEPRSGLDLPLKLLVREDADGRVFLTYNDPAYLQLRYGLSRDHLQVLATVEAVATAAAQ